MVTRASNGGVSAVTVAMEVAVMLEPVGVEEAGTRAGRMSGEVAVV